MAEDYTRKEQEQRRTDMDLVLLDVSHKKRSQQRPKQSPQEELSEEEEARRRARIRARQRRNRRRIQQRNRRIAMAAAGILCIVAIGVGIGRGKQERKQNKKRNRLMQSRRLRKGKRERKEDSVQQGIKTAKDSEKNQWYLKLVNAKTPLDKENLPEINTVPIQGGVYTVDKRIIQDLEQMLSDAYNAGRTPVVCSAYRDWDTQTMLFQNKIARVTQEKGLTGTEAETEAATVVARPGTSEHQLGLAVDITASTYTNLDEGQMETEDQQWLMENCWKYGFILRYPVDKTEITGVIFEPWHYRYVGKEAAKEITEQGITLEEYLGAEAVGDPREE